MSAKKKKRDPARSLFVVVPFHPPFIQGEDIVSYFAKENTEGDRFCERRDRITT